MKEAEVSRTCELDETDFESAVMPIRFQRENLVEITRMADSVKRTTSSLVRQAVSEFLTRHRA
jgi:predicted transcriptional regulator